MITLQGENAVGQTLAENLGSHIAVGIGSAVPTETDKELNFEVYRARIRSRAYDAANDRLVFTATIPEDLDLYVNEVALLTSSSEEGASILTAFDEAGEEWVGGAQTTDNVRYSSTGLRVALGTASMYAEPRAALSEVRLSDVIQVAYFGAGGTVALRFNNSETDYHATTFAATAGYNVARIPVSSLTKTGSPDLASANGITVIHSGTGSVTMDAIRVSHGTDEDLLITRAVMSTAYRKPAGMPLDIEIPVVVTK